MNETRDQEAPAERANEPAPGPKPIPKADTPHTDLTPKNHQGQQNDSLNRAMVRWTRVVGIFTFVLAIIGGIQAWAFIQSERAEIFPQVESVTPFEADKTPVIMFSTLNTGRSQAFISEFKIKGWFGELPDSPDYADGETGGGIFVPPGGGRPFQMGPMKSLNWAQIDDVKRGALNLYIFGYAKFTDSFSLFGPKTIGFCARYSPAGVAGSSFVDCKKPNYSYSR